MAKLTSAGRERLKQQAFAIPAKAKTGAAKKKSGNYPIPDASHARNALARVSQYGTSAEKAQVRAAVHRKYPNIGKSK
jgi:hypothetical protein